MQQVTMHRTAAPQLSRPAAQLRGARRSRPCSLAVRASADKDVADPTTPNRADTRNIEAGNVTPKGAEKRADIGPSGRKPTLGEAQAFDGPIPETVNNRLAMLGVVSALGAEFATGIGVREQVSLEPFGVIATFVIIAYASYIPVLRGFTRKEPFSNSFWSPKAENWNGRIAQLGFLGIVLTEALSGKNTLQFWGIR